MTTAEDTRHIHSSVNNLNAEQQQLLAFCLAQLNCVEKPTFRQFEFPHAISENYPVALSMLDRRGKLHHVFISLPNQSNKVFLIISDVFRPELAELVAYYCAQSETNDAITQGYVADLPVMSWESLRVHHWESMMVIPLQLAVENALSEINLEGENFELNLIVLLNKAEGKMAKKNGADSMLTFFSAYKRDLFNFKFHTDIKEQDIKKKPKIQFQLDQQPL